MKMSPYYEFPVLASCEVDEVIQLLTALRKGAIRRELYGHLTTAKLKIVYNTETGVIFLMDEDMNTFLWRDDTDEIDVWVMCPNCGAEGFIEDLLEEPFCDECRSYAEQVKECLFT